ncbi:MAG: sulfatase-like hydrolase/transferase, partial [Verrucomicrobiales bacterium]
MTCRQRLSLTLLIIAISGFCQADEARPNVVLIMTDDMGYADMSCQGSEDIRTPNLDRMAAEGTRFTDFYVAQPVCTASRAALMSGCYSNRVGLQGALNHTSRDNTKYHPVLSKEMPPLPFYDGEKIIELDPDQSLFTKRFTGRAVSFIEQNQENPFFLYVPHVMPHVPIFASEKFKGKSKHGLYGDTIEELDWSVGEILATIKRLG